MQPRVEGLAATAALASLLPAPLHAPDGKGGAVDTSQPGSAHSTGSASRSRAMTESPRPFSPRAGLNSVAGVNPRFRCGQLSPPAPREGGEHSGLVAPAVSSPARPDARSALGHALPSASPVFCGEREPSGLHPSSGGGGSALTGSALLLAPTSASTALSPARPDARSAPGPVRRSGVPAMPVKMVAVAMPSAPSVPRTSALSCGCTLASSLSPGKGDSYDTVASALRLDASPPVSVGEKVYAASLSPADSRSLGAGSRGWVETASTRPSSSGVCIGPADAHSSVLRPPPRGGDPAPDIAPEAEGLSISSDPAPTRISSSHSAPAFSGSARQFAASPLLSGASRLTGPPGPRGGQPLSLSAPSHCEGACAPDAGPPLSPPSRSEGLAAHGHTTAARYAHSDTHPPAPPALAQTAASDLKFEGPAPPVIIASKKAGNQCVACKRNLVSVRAEINRLFALKRKKRSRPARPPIKRPQHRYNTRSNRNFQPRNDTTPAKRTRLLPPPQGNDVLGANFPT